MRLARTPPDVLSARLAVQPQRTKPMELAGSSGKCLLVSPNWDCLEGMKNAATGALWDCVPCPKAEESLRLAFLHSFGLAIVDVGQTEHREALGNLFRILTGEKGLTIACDDRGDPSSELWARENGVWLYLPGEADWDSLTLACNEASKISQQLRNKDAAGATT